MHTTVIQSTINFVALYQSIAHWSHTPPFHSFATILNRTAFEPWHRIARIFIIICGMIVTYTIRPEKHSMLDT